jgi:hypothetical protein
MKYVYLLQSIEFPNETYVGLTDDLRFAILRTQCRTLAAHGQVQAVALGFVRSIFRRAQSRGI